MIIDSYDSERHKHLRHCFLLLVAEATGQINSKLMLHMKASLGYYQNVDLGKGVIYSEDPWLFNTEERKKYTISCAPVVQEGVSAVDREGVAYTLSEDDLERVWDSIYLEMRKDVRNNPLYDRDLHNCCSVSFGVLRTIRKKEKSFC